VTNKKPKRTRKQATREPTPEEREQVARWLHHRKINILLDHAAALCRVEEQRKKWRADLEEAKRTHAAAKAAAEELEILRAVGHVTLH
jgi:hypothetical protein